MGEWGCVPEWVVEEPKVSQSWCCPADFQGWGPEVLRASTGMLVDGVWFQGLWLQDPGDPGAGLSTDGQGQFQTQLAMACMVSQSWY